MTALATDNFNRADAGTLGSNWGMYQGMPNPQGIFSNTADLTVASNRNSGFYDGGVTWPNDQYAQAKVITMPDATGTWAVVVRGEAVSGGQRTLYAAGVSQGDFGNTFTSIWKFVANVQTGLANSGVTDIGVGKIVRLEAVGTTLTCYVDGVQKVQFTDSSIASGKPGIYSVHNAIDVGLFDDFEAGDFAAGGGQAVDSDYLLYQIQTRWGR